MAGSASNLVSLRARSLCFDDVDEMGRVALRGSSDYVPMQSGMFKGRFSEVEFSAFALRQIAHRPIMIHGEVPDRVSLQFVVQSRSEATANGKRFGPLGR